MTKCDEARRLLAEVPHAYKCSTYDEEAGVPVDDGRCDCHRVAIDAFLADKDIPAAREAVLEAALRRVRHALSPNELAVEAIKSEDPRHAHCTPASRMERKLTYEVIIAIDDALADTSPAAAALLANHQHFIQRCCLEALLEEVLENADDVMERGKEQADVVFELLRIHLEEVWEPTEKEKGKS